MYNVNKLTKILKINSMIKQTDELVIRFNLQITKAGIKYLNSISCWGTIDNMVQNAIRHFKRVSFGSNNEINDHPDNQ